MVDDDMICLQRLKRKAERFNGDDPVPAEDARRMVVDLIFCFVQFAMRTDKEITQMRKTSQERSSWKWWFIDRVLPTLVTWAILGMFAWIALVNQHVIVIPAK